MKAFRFPLDRVLGWRHLQMREEEEKLAALQHRLDLLNQRMNTLTAAKRNSELALLKLPSVQGCELQALTAFQARTKKLWAALDLEQSQCEKGIAAQRLRLLKARKDFRVLEKLKDTRKRAWTYLRDREVESTAADAHMSKLVRGDQ